MPDFIVFVSRRRHGSYRKHRCAYCCDYCAEADAQKNGQSLLSPFAQKNGQSAFTRLSVNLCK
jgi:hypothetical protein